MAPRAQAPLPAGNVPDRGLWTFQVPLLAIVLIGVAVRVAAARGDLWLDEIVSAEIARQVGSSSEVFTRVHHDNNHHLNTLWLLLAGDEPPLRARGLALASGVATLLLMALAAARRGWREAIAATLLASASLILVQYQSEARGYAPAMLCAVAASGALDRWLRTRRPAWAAAFAAAASTGLLSHLTFAFVLVGAAAWAGLDAWRRRRPDAGLLLAFGPPLAILAGLWIVDLRHLVRAGGPEEATWDVLREFWRATFGVPAGVAELLGLLPLALVGWQLARLWRAGDACWAFFAAAFAAALAPLLLRSPTDYLAPRYFVVLVPFLLLLVAEALAGVAERGRAGRVAFWLALALATAGAMGPVSRLLADGRGRYREAIRFMVEKTPGDLVTVATDHDFRNGTVLAFHAGRMHLAKGVALVTPGDAVPPPEWYLRHEFDPTPAPAESMLGPGDVPYRLAATFPYAGLSGWTWLLYHRIDAPGGTLP